MTETHAAGCLGALQQVGPAAAHARSTASRQRDPADVGLLRVGTAPAGHEEAFIGRHLGRAPAYNLWTRSADLRGVRRGQA